MEWQVTDLNVGPTIVFGMLGLVVGVLMLALRRRLTQRVHDHSQIGAMLGTGVVRAAIWVAGISFAAAGIAILVCLCRASVSDEGRPT